MDELNRLLYLQGAKAENNTSDVVSRLIYDTTINAMSLCIEICTQLELEGYRQDISSQQNNCEIRQQVFLEKIFQNNSVFDVSFLYTVMTQFIYPNEESRCCNQLYSEINSIIKRDEDSKNEEIELSIYERLTELKKIDGKNGLLADCFQKEKNIIEDLYRYSKQYYGYTDISKKTVAIELNRWNSLVLDYLEAIKNRILLCDMFDKQIANHIDSYLNQIKIQISEVWSLRKRLAVGEGPFIINFCEELYEVSSERNDLDELLRNMGEHWKDAKSLLFDSNNKNGDVFDRFVEKAIVLPDKFRKYLNIKSYRTIENEDMVCSVIMNYLGSFTSGKRRKIYWKAESFTESQFAVRILYKYLKNEDEEPITKRLDNWSEYTGNIHLHEGTSLGLLSQYIYWQDSEKAAIARRFETAINGGYDTKEIVQSFVNLFFMMHKPCYLFYNADTERLVEFTCKDDAKCYFENGENFTQHCRFGAYVISINKSIWFNTWLKRVAI